MKGKTMAFYGALTFAVTVMAAYTIYILAFLLHTRKEPGEQGIRSVWTDLFAIFVSIAIAAIPATLLGEVAQIVVLRVARTAIWGHRWGLIGFGVVYVYSLVIFFQKTWDNLFRFHEVPTANNGVLAPFGARWRRHLLAEGRHRLPWFVGVINVFMGLRVGRKLVFTEVSGDLSVMTIEGYREYAVDRPDEWLDVGDADRDMDQLFEVGAKEFVRRHTDAELVSQQGKVDMCTHVEEKLNEFGEQFADPDSIKVRISELRPPKEETDAAARTRAAIQENKMKKAQLDGFLKRLAKLKKSNPALTPQEAVLALQSQEGTVKREAFVIEGLQESVDAFTRAVGEVIKNWGKTT